MYYHKELGPTPTFGIELEVVEFKGRTTMLTVAAELETRGFMPANIYSRERHDYHCRCGTCQTIGFDIIYPGMWKMQRDASLPRDTGAEYISSPFFANEEMLTSASEAMEIIGKNANDKAKRTSERGGTATAGYHIHVHSNGPNIDGMLDGYNDLALSGQGLLYKFVPEIFALAASGGQSRGLEYRVPSVGKDHHNFIAVAGKTKRDRRLEWRIWEPIYRDTDYMLGAIVFSCAATQFLHREKASKQLGAIADLFSWDESNKSLDAILGQFSEDRMEILSEALMEGTAVKDDEYTTGILSRFLERV